MKRHLLIGFILLGFLNGSYATTAFFKTHTLVFFFSSQCPYCREFSPVVKAVADKYQARVLALSFDNQPLEGFSQFKPVTTQWVNAAYAGKPITYPALFVANNKDYLLYPVSYGAMNADELESRLEALQQKINAYESRSRRS